MRFLERAIMRIFSLIIMVISVVCLLVLFRIISISSISYITEMIQSYPPAVKVTAIICIVLFLMSLRGLFARLKPVDLAKNGIVLENGSGKLVISKESLENLISSVSKDIPGTESITSRTILDKNRNLKVYVNVVASQDVYLKDLSLELQKRVKEAMLKTADLEVKEVDVRIKSISNRKVKKQDNSKDKKNKKDNKKEEDKEVENKDEVPVLDVGTKSEENSEE